MPRQSIPRIEYLKVENYRALHKLELKNITPLTVFLGPNGSGKSTIIRALAGLIFPTKGQLYIKEIDLKRNPTKALCFS